MTDETRYLFAMTCVLPALVGFYLYRKMQPRYHLLIYMMLLDAVTETIVFIGIKNTSFTPIADCWTNAYMIITLSFFLTFVKRNGYIKKQLLWVFVAVAVILAVYEFYKEGSPFQTFYSLLLFYMYGVTLFIAINILSKQVTVVNTRLSRNFWFWAGCLFIVQNAYGVFVFGIYHFALLEPIDNKMIGMLTTSVNAVCYCLFAVVMFLVPKRNNHFIHKIS
jgi:hypothetical protein